MKFTKTVLIISSVLALLISGCGGGSGGSGSIPTYTTSSGLPTVSSTKAINALSVLGNIGFGSAFLLLATFDGNKEAKTTLNEPQASCTWTDSVSYWELTCVVWDLFGSADSADHKCDVTGIADPDGISFDIFYDCYDFSPADNFTLDGSFGVVATMDLSSFGVGSSVKSFAKNSKADANGQCQLSDESNEYTSGLDADESATCSWEESTSPICTEANAYSKMEFIVGSRSLTLTDECGSYNMTPGTTLKSNDCLVSNTQFTASLNIYGKFNGELIDKYYNINCAAN